MITYEQASFGCWVVYPCDSSGVREGDEDLLIQSDWDWPGLASNFGYVPCSNCDATDGTVNCAHRTVGDMITEAFDFLEAHEGEAVEDPGYFV